MMRLVRFPFILFLGGRILEHDMICNISWACSVFRVMCADDGQMVVS